MNLQPLLLRLTQLEQRHHERYVSIIWDTGFKDNNQYGPNHNMKVDEYMDWLHTQYDDPEIILLRWVDPDEY